MSDKDKALHKGLMKILNDGTFPLQARDVPVFSAVYRWANDLPSMMAKPKEAPIENKKVVKKKVGK